jgi:hypothetical protein
MASLDPDEDSSDASKSRAIGRKRNGYGKALGDVVLPERASYRLLGMVPTRVLVRYHQP